MDQFYKMYGRQFQWNWSELGQLKEYLLIDTQVEDTKIQHASNTELLQLFRDLTYLLSLRSVSFEQVLSMDPAEAFVRLEEAALMLLQHDLVLEAYLASRFYPRCCWWCRNQPRRKAAPCHVLIIRTTNKTLNKPRLRTLTRLSTASLTACTGRARSGIAFPSSASSCNMTSFDTCDTKHTIQYPVKL